MYKIYNRTLVKYEIVLYNEWAKIQINNDPVFIYSKPSIRPHITADMVCTKLKWSIANKSVDITSAKIKPYLFCKESNMQPLINISSTTGQVSIHVWSLQ